MFSPSLALFEAVFNSNPAGNYLLSPTPDAIILAVNDAFLKASSRTRAELIGVSLFAAFPGNPVDTEDSGEVALRAAICRTIETGTAQTLPAQRYPIRVTLPNGDVGYEERFWSAVNTPIFDAAGTLVCMSHSTIDVTDKVRSEAALRESEGRLRAYITTTSDVVYRMSPDWSFMHELDGRGFLKTTTGWAPYQIEDYVPPDDLPLARAAIAAAIAGKSVFELEHRVLRADGSYGWTYSKAVPLLDAHGGITEWIGAASDITERKLAELALRETDRRKDEFLAMLAHELRNPLSPISSAAELLLVGEPDAARVRRTSEIIVRQVKHMTSLVDDLLDVSRVTRGLVELDNAALDVRHIVADAVEQATPLIQARGHHLSLLLAPGETRVLGDKKRLVQVLANLINNAAKYTAPGGKLVVSTALDDTDIVLKVSDNGMGMESQLTERVFGLFAQAEVTSDRASGGLGLGLSLVKSMVELHGGTVYCESAGLGWGSTFTVRLPRLPDHGAAGAVAGQAPWQQRDAARRLRLLIVDDNVDAAEMLGMLLEAAGHTVFVEHSPTRALERARLVAPDVCLLDIGLPEMDGYELAQRLRAEPASAGAQLIAITGYGQEEDRARSRKAGFRHHVVKPVDTRSLMALLANVATP